MNMRMSFSALQAQTPRSSLPIMSTLSLCDLSAELILHVFKPLKVLFPAIAFNGTSRQYHSIWVDSVTAIMEFRLTRAIECYDQACERIEAETFFVNSGTPNRRVSPCYRACGTCSSQRKDRSRCASSFIASHSGSWKCMILTESTHFPEVTYRATTFACYKGRRLPYHFSHP